jgi:hypothetical protein
MGMGITRACYSTREQAATAADVKASAYANAQVDRALETSAESVEGLCNRRFWPEQATRYFDWPDWSGSSTGWRLWLDDNDLISVTSLVSGGTTIGPSDYFLRRSDGRDEAPYTHVEINLGTSSAFGGGATWQRSIAITGLWGHSNGETPAGALAEALDASEVGVDVTDSAAAGVGHLIRVDSERMLVTDKAMLTTGQTLQVPVTATQAADTLTVTSGAGFAVGETLLLDSERVLVRDIAGNSLLVRRAADGSTLAAHTGSTIYAPRTLTVVRGFGGTTAATHLTAASAVRHVPPGLVRDLALAYSVNQLNQEGAAYGRASGSGDHLNEQLGRGVVKGIEDDAYAAYGRKARMRAV